MLTRRTLVKNMFSSSSGDNTKAVAWCSGGQSGRILETREKTCACFSWIPITARPIMSVNAAPSLNRHDPTNPHPVSVVSGWNPAEECPELTRISPGLSGITQAGEGLSMIASLGWGVCRGGRICALVCVRVHMEGNMCQVVKYIWWHLFTCAACVQCCVGQRVWKTLDMFWFPHV